MDQLGRFVQRYLYDPEPMNKGDGVIICLGTTYESGASEKQDDHELQWPDDFLQDHDARFWFTYRTGFDKIMKEGQQPLALKFGLDGFTADTGFGCMIRSAQTLLANAMAFVLLGRDWRRGLRQDLELSIIRCFADDPNAPFSVHRFIEYGARACDKPAGQWFGPNAASLCIKALSEAYSGALLKVHLAAEQGGTIYEDQVKALSESEHSSRDFMPILILVPLRLGHASINSRYYIAILALFEQPQFIGIAGGRPSSAHYFFAKQNEKLFFLDPHFPRPSLPYHHDLAYYSDQDLNSVHTSRVRTMFLDQMDPSMLLGFVISSKADWSDWQSRLNNQRKLNDLSLISIISSEHVASQRNASESELEAEVMSETDGLQ